MKKCFKCLQVKPLSGFYVHPKMSDGYLGKCKECTKRDVITYRQVNIESVRAFDRGRGRTEKRKRLNRKTHKRLRRVDPERYRNRQRNLRAKEPEKYRARNAVNNAIRDGRLARRVCETCGKKAEAHHEDYSKPLDVKWLCVLHHHERHRKYRD
jgi:hypothetical protein